MHVPSPGTHPLPPGIEAPLSGSAAVLVGLAALAIVLIPFLSPLSSQLDTMAHEGAHAMVAGALGFTVLGVLVAQDASGVTGYLAPDGGPRRILTSFAGYLGPSAFGLCAAKLIETGHVVTVLWLATILLVLLLFLIRKSFGLVSVPVAIALLALVMRYAHSGLEEVIIYGITWLLLLSGTRSALVHGASAVDAETLASITHLPRHLWSLLWIAGTVLAVIIGGKWMVVLS